MNTTLCQNWSTRRHVKLEKFLFETPWLPDLLCKRWFASSVWNFCRWVADFPPRETSPAAKSEEKLMFSQVRKNWARSEIVGVWNFCRWVADVHQRETFPAAKSEEKRMLPQATINCARSAIQASLCKQIRQVFVELQGYTYRIRKVTHRITYEQTA